MTSNDLIEMNRRVSYTLWNAVSPNKTPAGLSPRLIFPELRGGNIRISEQEARLLWCTMLQDTSYYYSVEAPTTETYVQTGTKPQGARTDVALYRSCETGLKRVANIEFKAHNATQGQIRKDLEKLLREEITGNWFKEKYPLIKPGTISAHLLKLSTNAPSRVHYGVDQDGMDDLLFQPYPVADNKIPSSRDNFDEVTDTNTISHFWFDSR